MESKQDKTAEFNKQNNLSMSFLKLDDYLKKMPATQIYDEVDNISMLLHDSLSVEMNTNMYDLGNGVKIFREHHNEIGTKQIVLDSPYDRGVPYSIQYDYYFLMKNGEVVDSSHFPLTGKESGL